MFQSRIKEPTTKLILIKLLIIPSNRLPPNLALPPPWNAASALFLSTLTSGLEQEEDDDFSEFDEDEDESGQKMKEAKDIGKGDDEKEEEATVTDEEDENPIDEEIERREEEFSHFEDEEEFEGYKQDAEEFENKKSNDAPPPKTIQITKIPAHLHTNWENYYLEILMICGILVYFINFFTGKSKNQKIAAAWFNSHKSLLESNFALVGDDGAKDVEDIKTQLQQDSGHIYTLWCSGRTCCEGMLIELKLLKRQDLVSVISNLMKQSYDQLQVKVDMNPEDVDTYVFALALKKTATRMSKELNDINTYCPERRTADKYGVPSNYQLMSEIPEVSTAMLDSKLIAVLNPTDDQAPTTFKEGRPVVIFNFNLFLKNKSLDEAIEDTKLLMQLVFYFIDKVKRFKLSKEAKNKANKNRSKVAEAFWKSIHAIKAEKAQEEREKRRRELKERIREIEDPDKQRKLEDRENRRDRKRLHLK
ncbi:Coiled-coil domain-containing protein 47 [Lepeophtheirus salmonis]|uniref:PAT complex subunit CCDC47 n=1 Tax=Lepeophtheirus salmonis TaxID=72036 RepID=A0A7R8CLF5_LEPSM|nr:Coiled-coil domain-containing protein 47 [Lepeophtheirus salmonis]CAF2853530.1 Coiled-coil domain-containing protein 47 [Lepeophtheirus salmonis]